MIESVLMDHYFCEARLLNPVQVSLMIGSPKMEINAKNVKTVIGPSGLVPFIRLL